MTSVPKVSATFADLKFEPRRLGGTRAFHEFANGYSASIIRGPYTYGNENGLYELAVIADGQLCYDTPITNDVLGHLTEADVTETLAKIAALPPREVAK